jgi:hypothetical protein
MLAATVLRSIIPAPMTYAAAILRPDVCSEARFSSEMAKNC